MVHEHELRAIAALYAKLSVFAVIGGAHRLETTDRPHNSLYVFSDEGQLLTRYDKRYPSNSEVNGWYTPGASPIVFDTDGFAKGDRIVLLGCSVGGSCALEVASAAADRVAAIALIGTKVARRMDSAFHQTALETLRVGGIQAGWDKWRKPAFSGKASATTVEFGRDIALRQSQSDIARGVSVFHTRSGRDDVLSTFPRPILVITGDEDRLPGVASNTAQAQMAPDCRLHIIPECGHYVPIEKPQALNGILQRLLNELA